jgi:uridine kinase
MTTRHDVLDRIAEHLDERVSTHPLRVAVDGVTGAGKSTFARELTAAIARRGRPAIHLSTDDFHHVAARRHRDADRARGYYRDAYDLAKVRAVLLDPLGPGGDRRYRARSHDLETDALVDEPTTLAPLDAIVVVDGSFLLSPQLAGAWDDVIYLDVAFEVAELRAAHRDVASFGSIEAGVEACRTRYHAAGRLYAAEVDPKRTASIVVRNDDLEHPALERL